MERGAGAALPNLAEFLIEEFRSFADHLIDTAGTDGIVPLIDDELQLLEGTDKDPFAFLVGVYRCVEEHIISLKVRCRQINVKQMNRLNFLKILPINGRVHQ